jgi:Fe-S-cluster containining protein
VRYEGVELIFPMLEGRCRGKFGAGTKWKYVYGPCKHLVAADGKDCAFCSIHDDRPSMCKGYPYYSTAQAVMMGALLPDVNPGYMQGCGYNASADAGKTIREYTTDLLPLEKDEK